MGHTSTQVLRPKSHTLLPLFLLISYSIKSISSIGIPIHELFIGTNQITKTT
jgi:hypothetical protein